MENKKVTELTYNDLLVSYFELKKADINKKLKKNLLLILIEKMESVLYEQFKNQHII